MAPKGELIAADKKLRCIDAATGEVGREVSQSDAGNASLRGAVSFHPNGDITFASAEERLAMLSALVASAGVLSLSCSRTVGHSAPSFRCWGKASADVKKLLRNVR